MGTSSHTLACLFALLVVENTATAIEPFINTHKVTPTNLTLAEADFWASSQSNVIDEAITLDFDRT